MKIFLYLFLILTLPSCIENKDTPIVFGNWKIENMIFVSSPNKAELNEIWKGCINQEIIITETKFIFKSKDCFLYRNVDNFKLLERYSLSLEKAMNNPKYYDKTISYIFDEGKRKTLDVYKTNYDFKSSEGEVPELEIFIVDNNHLIINQDNNIVFLVRSCQW